MEPVPEPEGDAAPVVAALPLALPLLLASVPVGLALPDALVGSLFATHSLAKFSFPIVSSVFAPS